MAGLRGPNAVAGLRGPNAVAGLLDARAWGLDLALRAASALVAATGGEAMALSHPGQRLVREAMFYSIQAQSAELRRASLGRLTRTQDRSS